METFVSQIDILVGPLIMLVLITCVAYLIYSSLENVEQESVNFQSIVNYS